MLFVLARLDFWLSWTVTFFESERYRFVSLFLRDECIDFRVRFCGIIFGWCTRYLMLLPPLTPTSIVRDISRTKYLYESRTKHPYEAHTRARDLVREVLRKYTAREAHVEPRTRSTIQLFAHALYWALSVPHELRDSTRLIEPLSRVS